MMIIERRLVGRRPSDVVGDDRIIFKEGNCLDEVHAGFVCVVAT